MNMRLLIASAACALALGIAGSSFAASTTTNTTEGDSAVTGSAETKLSALVPDITKDSIDLKKPFGNLSFDMKLGPDKVATSMADDKSRMELAARCSLIDSEQLRVDDNSVPAFCKGYVDYYSKNYMK
jgi:hypothetical protein